MRRRDATLAQSPWRIVNMTRCRDSHRLLMPAVTLLAVLGAQPQLDELGNNVTAVTLGRCVFDISESQSQHF